MYKAPVLLNIGFSADLSTDQDGQRLESEFDYFIDKEFDINSFCKSVGYINKESSFYDLQAVVTFERSEIGIPCYFVYLRKTEDTWLKLSQ